MSKQSHNFLHQGWGLTVAYLRVCGNNARKIAVPGQNFFMRMLDFDRRVTLHFTRRKNDQGYCDVPEYPRGSIRP